eukprot:CAMPEP_0180103822 /NCGR_PEP_ID=MMETSP0985-20121206/31032_1 /TAXON_ID=483367 /ORGANISM="non described non described, Strain CCMP 2436" /LENGTH=88 /DNA_ID=CAMNT_0022040441 /DNA_START=189 /DNA_END=453 /DNA_ORIENTATION=-
MAGAPAHLKRRRDGRVESGDHPTETSTRTVSPTAWDLSCITPCASAGPKSPQITHQPMSSCIDHDGITAAAADAGGAAGVACAAATTF